MAWRFCFSSSSSSSSLSETKMDPLYIRTYSINTYFGVLHGMDGRDGTYAWMGMDREETERDR